MHRRTVFFGMLTITLNVATVLAVTTSPDVFKAFQQIDGSEQAAPISAQLGGFTLDHTNKFFDPGLGTNGQACVTCHQPADGYDIHVSSIQSAFAATGGADPLFRCNDTADNPFTCDPANPSTSTYNLFYNTGVVRFARTIPAGSDFTVAPQDTTQFGMQPHTADPEVATTNTTPLISVFRRPLINLNVRFDSSVLWDGREKITDLRTQVTKAAKSLLLAHTVSTEDADDVAAFMLGVENDTVLNTSFDAGRTSGAGATGGVANLVTLASDPNQPCRFDANGNFTASVTPALGTLTPSTCSPVTPGGANMTVFNAWANLTSHDQFTPGRLQVAAGEAIFNNAKLTVPPDLVDQLGAGPIHCTTCHAVNNLGNHPDANFLVRIGTDSVQIIQGLVDNPGTSTVGNLQSMLDRVAALPQYCLRPNSDTTPFTTAACGTHNPPSFPGDVMTTDPGRATVTGKIADVGKFKPPVLRNFIARAPYFHAGAAIEDNNLVDFYNARFQIGLTPGEHDDLVAWLNSF
jgi:cytochrome c peroxidase